MYKHVKISHTHVKDSVVHGGVRWIMETNTPSTNHGDKMINLMIAVAWRKKKQIKLFICSFSCCFLVLRA